MKLNKKNIVLAACLLAAVIGAIAVNGYYKKKIVQNDPVAVAKQVGVEELGERADQAKLSMQGTVKAASKIDVVALANGTVKFIDFKSGDKITVNQPLAELYDSALMTNLYNASTNVNNVNQNYRNTSMVTDEAIKQAQLGTTRAQEAVAAAEIAAKASKENYENAKAVQVKNGQDIKSNAVVAVGNYLNTINSFLEQANYIIKAEGSEQLPGIDLTLSVRNPGKLIAAKNDYLAAHKRYMQLAKTEINSSNVGSVMNDVVLNLSEAKKLADNMVDVLSATVAHSQFSETALLAQKSSFTGMRSSIVSTQAAAQATNQSLDNFELISKQQLDALANAQRAAENQLSQAKLAQESANAGLSSAQKSRTQQLGLSQSSLDGAQGQYQLLENQADDLTVRAPISGEITAKSVEVGTEVRIGQKLAEISQIDSVKVVIGVSPEDVSLIKLGQKAVINGVVSGAVNQIDPAADSVSKKVKVEIVVDNKDKALIPETLVDVAISVKPRGTSGSVYKLPLKALTISQNENFIFTIDKDRAKKVAVTLDRVEGEVAVIKTDLSPKTLIIIDGNKLLEDGQSVEIKK
ncbi:HlyD family efflux transporter periplasmic adaptor subunit [Candidatus Falkowbacteria bacterium]|nr:HlyD family efflux transporter periplasmic adaptor subunit [Candidatus Falkowbacteria bacterium]